MKSTLSRFSVIFISILFCSVLGFSQDQIFLRSGEKIDVRVIEVTPEFIKYKSKANPEGPLYSKKITDVLLITYANGTTEVYEVEKVVSASTKNKNDTAMIINSHSLALNFVPLLYQQLELDYQYLFPNRVIGISFPITYVMNPGITRSLNEFALLWSAGSDLKFYFDGQKSVSFYVGFGFDVGQAESISYYTEEIVEYDEFTGLTYPGYNYVNEDVTNNFYSLSGILGVEINPTKFLTMDIGGRISGRSHFLDKYYNSYPYYEESPSTRLDLIIRPLMRLRVRF